MKLPTASVEELPDGSRRLTVRVQRHPASRPRSVVAYMNGRPFGLSPDTSVPPSGEDVYYAVLPPRLGPGYFKVEIQFRRGDKYQIFLVLKGPSKSVFQRKAEAVGQIIRNRLKSLSLARFRGIADRKRREELVSTCTRIFVERVWARWVGYVLKEKPKVFIINNPERIGHLASESEIFFCEMEKKLQPLARYCFVIRNQSFVEGVGIVSIKEQLKDSHLIKMLKRKHFVVNLNYNDAYKLPAWMFTHLHTLRSHLHRDVHGVLDATRPRLSFTEKEMEDGWRQLRALGLTPETPFVCLHLRESGFVKNLYQGDKVPGLRYAYRDVSSEDYMPAVKYLMEQGFHVVRLGVPPVPQPSFSDPRYIDYANKAQSSFLDLFLCAHCSFFLGTTSGLYAVADLFRKPILYTNFAPLRHVHSWSYRFLTVPKLACYRKDGQLLRFEDLLARGFGEIVHGEKIESLGIDYISNTPEEILEATEEMVGRLRGVWEETPRDWHRQERFWNLIPRDDYNKVIRSRISARFLERHEHLLPPLKALPAPRQYVF